MRKFLIVIAFFAGCTLPATQRPTPKSESVLFREVRRGMSQSEVETILGSPSVVARDGEQSEIWEYDKIATSIDSPPIDSPAFGSQAPTIQKLNGLKIRGVKLRSPDALDSDSPDERPLSIKIRFDHNNAVDELSYFISKH